MKRICAADTSTANPSHIDLQNLHYRALSLSETFAVLFMVAVFEPQLTLAHKAGFAIWSPSPAVPTLRLALLFASVTDTDKTLLCGVSIALSSVAVYSRLNVTLDMEARAKNVHASKAQKSPKS